MAQEKRSVSQILRRFRDFRYFLVLEGVGVGIAAGLVTVLFRITLERADTLRQTVGGYMARNPWLLPVWFLLLLGAAGLVTLLLKWEPLIGGSGIPQVEGEMQGELSQTWWKVLTAKFVGGVLCIGAGLSLGREGPSIQLGAMAGKGVSRLARRNRTEEKMLMTCGASAGLAAAFNAPLAGVLFSLEELHKNFSVEVLLSTMSASITADFISRNVFGLKPVFDFSIPRMMPLKSYWMVLLLGLLLGLLGALYNLCVKKSQDWYGKIPWPYVKVAFPFLLSGVLLMVYPIVLGGGHSLVELVSNGMGLRFLLLLFVSKFIYSMISFGSGAPGGIFLPLLVLGAVAGGTFSGLLSMCGMDNELGNFVILGMAGLFSAIVRAPVTGIILISEMTGSFSHLLTLSLVSLTAYVVADLLRSKPVYDQLLSRLLKTYKGSARIMEPSGEKVLVESPVHHGAPVCGRPIKNIDWPSHSLIVSVKRGETELVPKGDTCLMAGDHLVVLCDERDSRQVLDTLEAQCKRMDFRLD